MADWSDFADLGIDLLGAYGAAKIASEVRPPAPAPAPAPVRAPSVAYLPPVAYSAQANDISLMVGDILSSPRTWLGLGAIVVLVVVFIKLRR